ncbi:MAG: hypothetical protein QOD75_2843 [Blastocatellia bacterium]|jgi:hypothetical protein|nr:hypothetical protein [Blastocatellia bacterium]
MATNELIIAVYLNQRIVFDLIAILQDGMSTVTRINSSEETKNADTQRYGAAFGLSQALSSLLKIDVSGDRAKLKEGSSGTQRSEERVHTPSSLFQKLRSKLLEENKIQVVNAQYTPEPGDIVEFSTSLRRNPLIQVMDTFGQLFDMAMAFDPQPQKGGHKNKPNEMAKLKSQIGLFSEMLKAGDTVDIVSDNLECGHRAVITLDEEYLNDPTMADLVDGQFQVVGKVIRVIDDSKGSVNLLRKGAVGSMNKQVLETAFAHFNSAAVTASVDVPSIEWEIHGPVIQIIPIAIFA